MGGNDPLVAVVERHGIRTYSTGEIAARLLDLCSAASRAAAAVAPLDVDLTGGLGDAPIDIKALRAEAMADAAAAAASDAVAPAADKHMRHTHPALLPPNSSEKASACSRLKACPSLVQLTRSSEL